MPNWCSNDATISHADPEQIERIAKAFKTGELFSEFVPIPKDLIETTSGFYPNKDDQANLELKQKINVEMHGYPDWYGFCISEWGTKWDAVLQDEPEISVDSLSIKLIFDTAWSPPIAWYHSMLDKGFNVTAGYYEPGMMFVGRFVDGHDECFKIPDDIEDISSVIPRDIDEKWGITDSMQQYDDD